MRNQYTAIYTNSWMSGSHRQTLAQMRRIVQRESETVADMLEREDIADCTVFLFHGHSPLQDEDVTPNIELTGSAHNEKELKP